MLKLSDTLLYPREYHSSHTNKKLSLYAGILLVGFADLFLPDFIETSGTLFFNKTPDKLLINILLAILTVVLLGIVDVVAFSLPLFDLFKIMKEKAGEQHTATAFKVMKVYISSHFILLPLQILIYFSLFRGINENSSDLLQNLFAVYFFIMLVWQTAIVARGINILFRISVQLRRLTFVIVFSWNMILMVVFSYQLFPWIIKGLSLAGITFPG